MQRRTTHERERRSKRPGAYDIDAATNAAVEHDFEPPLRRVDCGLHAHDRSWPGVELAPAMVRQDHSIHSAGGNIGHVLGSDQPLDDQLAGP